MSVPEHRYAVFRHAEHVSTIRRTHTRSGATWLPESGYEVADAPTFERYGEDFDGPPASAAMEIWLPIR